MSNTHAVPTQEIVELESFNEGLGVSFVQNADVGFALHRTAVQIGLHEMQPLASVLPILLQEVGDHWRLLAMTGFSGGRNLMIAPGGGWMGYTQPDCLRFYPLILAQDKGGEPRLVASGKSHRLFSGGQQLLLDKEGKRTQHYDDFVQRLALQIVSSQRVQAAASLLKQAKLLWKPADDSLLTRNREGSFYSVNIAALANLAPEVLLDLRNTSGLTIAYAIHFSAGNANKMRQMLQRQQQLADPDVAGAFNTEPSAGFNFDQ